MAATPPQPGPGAATWVIAGASGVVGRHLVDHLIAQGCTVRKLTTHPGEGHPAGVEVIGWEPRAAASGPGPARDAVAAALAGADVLCNLAGATLGEGRLTAALKDRILHSRLTATGALAEAWNQAAAGDGAPPPPTWVQASAVGYYGDTGEADVTEATPPADDFFLAEVARRWEDAAAVAGSAESPRLVACRIGLVLAADAPAWQKILLPIKLGAGGPLGSGRQWWPWVDADDVARAMHFLAGRKDAGGAYNLTAPEPARQLELAKAAAKRLRRPAILPTPAFALRLVLGEAADQLLLPSCKALPTRLLAAGFEFRRPDLAGELDKLLA